MKILITGANGQLGTELRRCLETMEAEIGPIPPAYEGAQVDYVDCDELDITDAGAVIAYIVSGGYNLIINCAAYTNVDGCEENEEAAFAVNEEGVRNIAAAARVAGATVVQLSTDYVFPGTEEGDRSEEDEPSPLSVYGASKLAGEQAISEICDKYYIVRTAWLYGYEGKNFVATMRKLGAENEEVRVVCDQFGNPTSANDLAYEILKIAQTDDYGIYHCTNKGTCSWADFAEAIMKEGGYHCNVIPVSSEEYKKLNPHSADRPKNSSLQNKRLEDTIGDEMRPWQEALAMHMERVSAC